ncbi:MAG: hypothetical protein J6J23_04510 [Clostridia bacterium]|nr:hypothetical protein [Clostridia bacterium]
MKISERCKKQIEQINQAGLKLKESEYEEPYDFVMWNSDFESIMELYLSYEDTIKQLNQTEHLNALEAENAELKEENEKLKDLLDTKNDQVSQLHTIKKSFEVLRALYLGDYEDEPF